MNIDNMNSDMGLLLIIRNYFSSHYKMKRYIYENEAIMKKAGYIFELADMAGPLMQFGTLEDHNRDAESDYRKLFEGMAEEIGVTYRDLHLALRRLMYRDARYHNKILHLRPEDFYRFMQNNREILIRDIKAALDAYHNAVKEA